MENSDISCMQEALALARLGWGHTNPNPMVGAVVTDHEGRIIGRGFHARAGCPHAEVNAIQDALTHHGSCAGGTIYVTLEPCCTTGRTPPCTQAILDAGLKRVVSGALDPNPKHAGRGIELLRARGVECVTGVCHDECIEINRPFFKYITTGLPFVILKMAMTLDGKIAAPTGAPSGSPDRRPVPGSSSSGGWPTRSWWGAARCGPTAPASPCGSPRTGRLSPGGSSFPVK